MSTDYGFKCLDCNEQRIVDNLRSGNVSLLRSVLDNITAITQLTTAGFDVSAADCSGFYGMGEAIRFVADHQGKQHLVAISDEYGAVWGSCTKHLTCPTCRSSCNCNRDDKHEGECKP
jgi:hypothetical protein